MSIIGLFSKWISSNVSKRLLALPLLSIALLSQPGNARVLGIGSKVLEALEQAQQLSDQKDFSGAERSLQRLQDRRLNAHEQAQVHSMRGSILAMQEKTEPAIKQYLLVLSHDNIPDGLVSNTLRILAQLYMAEERPDRALHYIDKLLARQESPNPSTLALKAQCHYLTEQFAPALDAIDKAITLDEKRGGKPRENWLLLHSAVLHAMNDYTRMEQVVNKLLEHYPKNKYVYKLAAIKGLLESPKEQLSLLEPLYETGYLEQRSQKLVLAQLYLLNGVPVKAALLLEELRSNADKPNPQDSALLAQAWMLAKENHKAVKPMAEAAQAADDGMAFLRLANIHILLQDWQAAQQAITAAIQKGELNSPGNAYVMLGMVRYRLKEYNRARQAFVKAGNYPPVEKTSTQWLEFLKQEQAKRAAVNS